MNKAIILSQIPLNNHNINLLKMTNILKIALNHHAEYLKPCLRICTDYSIATILLNKFKQNVVTIRDYSPDKRIIYKPEIIFKGSTIVAAIEFLILSGYKEILLVADNTIHDEWFKNRVNKEIDKINKQNKNIKIYQFSNGNFNLDIKSVEDFTNDER